MFKTARMNFISIAAHRDVAPRLMAFLAYREFIQLSAAEKIFPTQLVTSQVTDRLQQQIPYLENSLNQLIQKLALDVNEFEKFDDSPETMIGLFNDTERMENLSRELSDLSARGLQITERAELLQYELDQLFQYSHTLLSFENADFKVNLLRKMRYYAYHWGFIAARDLLKLKESLEKYPSVLHVLGDYKDKRAIIVFVLKNDQPLLDSILKNLDYVDLDVPDQYQGTISEVLDEIELNAWEKREELIELREELKRFRDNKIDLIARAFHLIRYMKVLLDGFQQTLTTESFIYLSGWVPEVYMKSIYRYIQDHSLVETVAIEVLKDKEALRQFPHLGKIPTMLWNYGIVKPFEVLVTTYGYPGYDDIDPTPIVSLGFLFLFGLMFGDIGHGLVLALIGLFLRLHPRLNDAGVRVAGSILLYCGGASMLFGWFFGSIFCFEELIPPLWFSPLHHINQLLAFSIVVGVSYLSLGILLNVIQLWRKGNYIDAWLGHNGMVSFVFYWSLLSLAILSIQFGYNINLLAALTILVGLLSLILFKEQIGRIFTPTRQSRHEENESIIQQIFEMIEMVMSYFTNTVSFVRVGAFALNHAALGSAIFLISDVFKEMVNSGALTDALNIILGNAIIILMEGMVVGIQTVRLHYYEFFSKFFDGNGTKFEPLTLK